MLCSVVCGTHTHDRFGCMTRVITLLEMVSKGLRTRTYTRLLWHGTDHAIYIFGSSSAHILNIHACSAAPWGATSHAPHI